MRHTLSLLLSCAILGVLFLTSCDKSAFFEENQHVASETWKQGDTLYYKLQITDTIHYFDFYLNVRNSTDYRYRNLYLFMNTKFPGGGIARDTIECMLAAADGKWYGKGMGKIKDSRILFKKAVRFPHAGTYLIGIQQAMREVKLAGISDIGVRIESH
jgi:gliding motility-associated lipoprotein GldH